MNTHSDIKKRFFDCLKRGTGEAYLIMQDNPSVDFSAYIIRGALRNYAYDGQSENSRAQYIFDLANLTNKKEKIRKAVLKGLATEQDDTWSLTHLFDLARLYAEQGDHEAKQLIYDRFLHNPIFGSDWVGYYEILALDGFEGLVYIAEKYGKYIEQNPEDWQYDFIIDHFQEDNPRINAKKELKKLALTNKYIDIYLKNIATTKKRWRKNRSKSEKFDNVVDEVLSSKHFLGYQRSKTLTTPELDQIAERLLVEKDRKSKEKLIQIFTGHKFPLDSELMLDYARIKTKKASRIPEFASRALKYLKSESIRTFALDKITTSKKPEDYIDILVSNYQSGDAVLLTKIAENAADEHTIEHLAGSYVDIFRANKTAECKAPLEVLYSKMNCGIHRNAIVEVLIDNNVLSDRIRREIEFDSFLETRELLEP